jgi:lysophospholipase L1-like esterase
LVFAAVIWLSNTSFTLRTGWYTPPYYPCVNYQFNRIVPGTDHHLYNFFKRLNQFTKQPEGKVSVVHIGDSHIQADYLSEVTRTHLQYTFGNGGRGFVFPFRLARTNGPLDMRVYGEGTWEACKSTNSRDECNYGISGINLNTVRSGSKMVLKPKENSGLDYSFNKVRLFYDHTGTDFGLVFNDTICPVEFDEQPVYDGYSEVYFPEYQDSLVLTFDQSVKLQNQFRLQGFSLENDAPGVLYHAIGNNGAYVQSYLRCSRLPEQLNELNPDLVILSLGTNDGYMSSSRFCANCFKENYRKLIQSIVSTKPNASILLTTPGDHFIRRRYHNRNISKIVNAIHELAEEEGCAVWDFNKIMGGAYSIRNWNRQGLARRDLIHFTKDGYRLQGFLLYSAIMESYEKQFN